MMVRALGREIRRLVVNLVALAVSIGGLIVVWSWMSGRLVEIAGGL